MSHKLCEASVLLTDSVLGTHYTTLLLYIR